MVRSKVEKISWALSGEVLLPMISRTCKRLGVGPNPFDSNNIS